MRSVAILALLMLALAGLALPAATAETPAPTAPAPDMVPPCACPPPPQCAGMDTVGIIAQVVRITVDSSCDVRVALLSAVACTSPLSGTWTVQEGRLTVTAPCKPQLQPCEPPLDCYPEAASAGVPPLAVCQNPDMCNDAGCPYPVGAEDGTDLWVGPVHVQNDCGPQDLCSGPFRCTSPFGSSSSQIPPVCIQREASTGVAKAGVDSCREDHETTCTASPQRIHHYEEVAGGLAYAQVDYCLPHMPPPGASAASAQSLPVEVHVVPNTADPLHPHVDVYAKADIMDCLFGEGYNPTPVGPALTLWVWGCRPPYPPDATAAASQPCICPPPRPLCYEVNRAIAWGDQVQADDYCNVTVTLTADCGLQGSPEDHQVKEPKVTVNYQTCQGPPPAASSAAVDPFPTCIRDCSPLPDEACPLRDATPAALQHPLWGYDCTLDVETSCLDGSTGGAIQQRIGFVNIDIAMCGGNPPPWS